MKARTIVAVVDAYAKRQEEIKDKRRNVDRLRVLHERLSREVDALDNSGSAWRSPVAVAAMREELARTTRELRAATRDLIRSI